MGTPRGPRSGRPSGGGLLLLASTAPPARPHQTAEGDRGRGERARGKGCWLSWSSRAASLLALLAGGCQLLLAHALEQGRQVFIWIGRRIAHNGQASLETVSGD